MSTCFYTLIEKGEHKGAYMRMHCATNLGYKTNFTLQMILAERQSLIEQGHRVIDGYVSLEGDGLGSIIDSLT